MKIIDKQHTDQSAGVVGEVAISFEANAVAFFAQISGLAKDKIGYPIRELSTNAWDASRGDFEVRLPTSLNPNFTVRDYGPGMSKHQMESVYARLYASTKRQSDDQVGGWGLGSKSPYAYLIGESGAGAYTVTSYHGGMMFAYTMSLNAGGQPVMRLLAEMPSNERTGLEVSFPVRREDIRTFSDRARHILWSFEPRPVITPAIEWAEPVVQMDGEGWVKYASASVPFRGPHVRMGCVMYPFDLTQIEHKGFLNGGDDVVFEAKIGSLSVNLSREQLGYDERTKNTLKALVAQFERDVVAVVKARVEEKDTYFEACQVFEEQAQSIGPHRLEQVRKVLDWNGYNLIDHKNSDENIKFMRLREGWTFGDDFHFERGNFYPRSSIGTHIVVEHNPCRSKERLVAAGMLGNAVLWIRVKRENIALAEQAIGGANYTVLDDFKTEVRAKGSVDKTKKIRVRRTMVVGSSGMTYETRNVDLLEGGLYVRKHAGGHSRYYGPTYSIGDLHSINEQSLRKVLQKGVESGAIKAGTMILLATDKDELGDNWAKPRDSWVEALREVYAPTEVSSLHGKSDGHFDHEMRQLFRLNIPMTPEFGAIKDEYRLISARLSVKSETTPSEMALEALRALEAAPGERPESAEECPIEALNRRFNLMMSDHQLLSFLITNRRGWYGNNDDAHISRYFEMLAEIEQLKADRDSVLEPVRAAA